MKLAPKADQKEGLNHLTNKWTRPLIEAGWTGIPNVILERQQALGLDPLDVNILLQLATFWWFAENLPRPSKKTIAERVGVDPSTVRKRIARLEKDGLIKREPRYHSQYHMRVGNDYSFQGLIQATTPFALELIK